MWFSSFFPFLFFVSYFFFKFFPLCFLIIFRRSVFPFFLRNSPWFLKRFVWVFSNFFFNFSNYFLILSSFFLWFFYNFQNLKVPLEKIFQKFFISFLFSKFFLFLKVFIQCFLTYSKDFLHNIWKNEENCNNGPPGILMLLHRTYLEN